MSTAHITLITEWKPANCIADAIDHLVRTLFVSDGRMTRRERDTFGMFDIAPDEPSDRNVPVERGRERRRAVSDVGDQGERFDDPTRASASVRSVLRANVARSFNHALTRRVQFRAYGKELALASNAGSTDGVTARTRLFACRIRWMMPSGTNEGG
jgi:hypothetical protein